MSCSTCGQSGGCGCVSNYKEKDFGLRTMWTLGGMTPGAAIIVLPDETVADVAPTIEALQGTIIVAEATVGFKAKLFFQISGDGGTWDNPIALGAGYQVGNGTLVYDWHNTTTNYKRKIRFVVQAEQDGTNVLEVANVRVVIGFQIR